MADVSSRGRGQNSSAARAAISWRGLLGAFRPFRFRFFNKVSSRGATDTKLAIMVAAQNHFYSSPTLAIATTGICTISGRYVFDASTSSSVSTWAGFLAKTQTQVEDRLRSNFLTDDSPEIDENTYDVFILDIEGSAQGFSAHPSDLHTHADPAPVIAAWRTRINAVRAVFPNAKVALYGTLVPDGQGRASNATYLAREAALVAAGEAGAFDDLDYLVPIIYPEFGPTDSAWLTYDDMTTLGIEGSRKLKKSDGSSIPLLPLIGVSIGNGNSNHNGEMLLDLPVEEPLRHTWGRQIQVLKGLRQPTVAVWVGDTGSVSVDVMPMADNTPGYTVNQFIIPLATITPPDES